VHAWDSLQQLGIEGRDRRHEMRLREGQAMNAPNSLRSPMFRAVNGWPRLRLVASKSENPVGQTEAFNAANRNDTMPKKPTAKRTEVKSPKVIAAEPSATTADDIKTINAIRNVCFDSVVGKTPSPIARAFFEAISKVSEQALWGVDCEKGATAAQRAYVPHVVRMLRDMGEQAFQLSTSIESEKAYARIVRARELLTEAHRDRDAGKSIDVIVAELIAHETPDHPNRIDASADAWTDAVTHWQGIAERLTGPLAHHWSGIVYKLLNPDATPASIRKGAETMRENFKSRQAKKKSPSRK
jgi:hypothetical protein